MEWMNKLSPYHLSQYFFDSYNFDFSEVARLTPQKIIQKGFDLLKEFGDDPRFPKLRFGKGSTEEEISQMEINLGISLPEKFKTFLTHFRYLSLEYCSVGTPFFLRLRKNHDGYIFTGELDLGEKRGKKFHVSIKDTDEVIKYDGVPYAPDFALAFWRMCKEYLDEWIKEKETAAYVKFLKKGFPWIRYHRIRILFVLFLVDWFISTLLWISKSPQANISSTAFYTLFLLVMILATWLDTFIEADIFDRNSKMYDLYFVVIVWILTRITDFLVFDKVSFALIFLIAFNSSLGIQEVDKRISKKVTIPTQIIFNAILIVIFYFVTPEMFWHKEPGSWIFVVFYGLVYGLITYFCLLIFESKIITLEITAIAIIIIGFWFMNTILIIIFIIITVIIVLISTCTILILRSIGG